MSKLKLALILFCLTAKLTAYCQNSDSIKVNRADLLHTIKLAQDGLVCDSLQAQFSETIWRASQAIATQDSVEAAQARIIDNLKDQVKNQQGVTEDTKKLVTEEKKKTRKWRWIAFGAIGLAVLEFLSAP